MPGAKNVQTPLSTSASLSITNGSNFSNASEYQKVDSSLQYLSLSRLNIAFTVHKLSQFMHKAIETHWEVTKHLLHYLKDTINDGVFLRKKFPLLLCTFSDVNWVRNKDDRTSICSEYPWEPIAKDWKQVQYVSGSWDTTWLQFWEKFYCYGEQKQKQIFISPEARMLYQQC